MKGLCYLAQDHGFAGWPVFATYKWFHATSFQLRLCANLPPRGKAMPPTIRLCNELMDLTFFLQVIKMRQSGEIDESKGECVTSPPKAGAEVRPRTTRALSKAGYRTLHYQL